MLLTDSPELAHLQDDQVSSFQSFSAPTQSKMVCLKWFPISETIHRGTGSRDIHLFLYYPDSWIDIMLVQHLFVEHLFAAEFGQTCKAWRILAASICNCKDSDEKLVYGVRGIGERVANTGFMCSWSL